MIKSDQSRGIFAADYIAALDGVTVIAGGWVNHHYIQLAYQLCNCVIGFVYAFLVTSLILWVMLPFRCLSLRIKPEDDDNGIDNLEIGLPAYDLMFDVPLLN